MSDGFQFDNGGGGVGIGVIVTVVCSTESRDAEWLPARSRVTTSLSESALLLAVPPIVSTPPAPRLPALDIAVIVPLATAFLGSSALLPVHCTAPPRPMVTDSHFCLPLFFFLRLKKQQHLEMKQALIGLRVVPLATYLVNQHLACNDGTIVLFRMVEYVKEKKTKREKFS